MTKKLSPAQQKMLDTVLANGSMDQPFTSGRASVTLLSAWHRTAKSLADRGLVKVERSGGNTYRVVKP